MSAPAGGNLLAPLGGGLHRWLPERVRVFLLERLLVTEAEMRTRTVEAI